MLSNAYLLAKFCFDTAENERNFAEILPKLAVRAPMAAMAAAAEGRPALGSGRWQDRAGSRPRARRELQRPPPDGSVQLCERLGSGS